MQTEGFGRQGKRPLQASLTKPWIMQQHLQTVLILCPLAYEFQDSKQSGFNYLLSIFPSNKVMCILQRYSVPLADQNGVVFSLPIESSSPWNICRPVGGHGNFGANWLPEQLILVSTNTVWTTKYAEMICGTRRQTQVRLSSYFNVRNSSSSHSHSDNLFSLLTDANYTFRMSCTASLSVSLMKYCKIHSFCLFVCS